MFLAKVLMAACMMLGLFGTFIHRLPGTPLIFFSALIYCLYGGFTAAVLEWLGLLCALMVIAELGGGFLQRRFLSGAGVGKVFALDAAAGSFASLVLTDVLAGTVFGLILWELLLGKSLMPVLRRSGVLVLKLCVVALSRFVIGVMMIMIVLYKIL